VIDLPPNTNGYYLVWERCCRNSAVVNLNQADQTPMVFYHELANPAIQNNSPVFNSPPLPFTCLNSLFRFNFTATDPDGDSLVYTLSTPLAGGYTNRNDPNPFSPPNSPGGQSQVPEPRPYNNVVWASGFSLANICSGPQAMTIDPVTGMAEGIPTLPGLFAMAVNVYEYRNGLLIGMVRREIEFTVITCNDNSSPNLTPGIQNATYAIFETDTLTIDVTAVDPDGDSLFLVHSGDVFAAASTPGLSAPFAESTDTVGIDSVRVLFSWITVCGHARDSVYRVEYEIRDNGCPLPLYSIASITIRVLPVPEIPKPNLLCMELADDYIALFKDPDTSLKPRYFESYRLYRSTNGGPYLLVGQYNDPSQSIFRDSAVSGTGGDVHCYFMTGTNSCGRTCPPSDTLCTSTQANINPNIIRTATVAAPNAVEIRWADFPDGPFSTYVIERKNQTTGTGWQEVVRLNGHSPYSWTDFDVTTASSSYCYRLRNINACGNRSVWSNEACTILLEGEAEPFGNDLRWNAYKEWPGGVERYALMRMRFDDPAGFNLRIDLPDGIQVFDDGDIPNSGGPYRYLVVAHENGGNNEESRSNEIELVQPPLLFAPAAFTPNGDSYNNNWKPEGAFIRTMSWTVYNRWGQEVFSCDESEKSWDGTFEGSECPEGLYAWKIRYSGYLNDKTFERTGIVHLIR
jgi:gliding motility-associated-like protein